MRKKVLKWILLILVAALASAGAYYYYYNLPEQRVKRILKEADASMSERSFAEAEELYDEALEIDPENESARKGKVSALCEQADASMSERSFAEAEKLYDEALEIDPENKSARKGKISALFEQADALAVSAELSDQVRACGIYREIIRFCGEEERAGGAEIAAAAETAAAVEDAGAGETAAAMEVAGAGGTAAAAETALAGKPVSSADPPAAALEKLIALEKKIAASFESVAIETVTDDRSETVTRMDGTEASRVWYFDLVQVTDEYYPYSEKINAVLRSQKDAFFSESSAAGIGKNLPAAAIGMAYEDEFMDYVGEAGIYNENGILSIRMAEVRAEEDSLSNYYCGKTFRLSDAKQLSLMDASGMDAVSLRRLLKKKLRAWFKEEGYLSISKRDVEKYVEDTEPEAFQYCIREDGEICMVIDQQVPFFAGAQEVLEIPLDLKL